VTEADGESHQVPIVQDVWEGGGSVGIGVFSVVGVDAVGRIPA
jgi:hypothetical protein